MKTEIIKPHLPQWLFAEARSIIKLKIKKDEGQQFVLEMFDYGQRCYGHLHPEHEKSGDLAPEKGGE